jgi:transposase-like protein
MAQKKMSALERVNRNDEIAAAVARGLSYATIARSYGLTAKQVQRIHHEWREENPSIRRAEAVEIVDRLLEGYTADIEELALLSATTQSDSARVASINARMMARGQIRDLLQRMGVLPKDLGKITADLDAQETANKIMHVLKQHKVDAEIQDAMLEAIEDQPHADVDSDAEDVDDE